ncbi:MAG: hypothetical protein DSY80_10405 [Desulfocapsa sp.]|nr:MAG: hypothetical protein DSY80_10405 [Desulfocapsa sp.]
MDKKTNFKPDFTPKTEAQKAINELIELLRRNKPGNRSPIDRAYAIVIRELEFDRAYIFMYNLK